MYSNYDFPSPSPMRSSFYDIYLLTLCVCFCPSKHLEVRGRLLRVVLTVYPLVSRSLLRLSVLAAITFVYAAISAVHLIQFLWEPGKQWQQGFCCHCFTRAPAGAD